MNKFFAAVILLIFNFLIKAQTGLIYNIAFKIDNELVTQTKSQNKDYKILNLATVEDMPKEVSDTIMLISEKAMEQQLKATVSSIIPQEKLVMGALPEHLMYLPANTLNKAIKTGDKDFYINIQCHVAATGGTKITFGKNSFSKVKPKLSLKISAYNKNKSAVYEKEIILKDFEKLRSHTFEKTYGIKGFTQNTDEVTVSETLTSNDILKMYLMALEAIGK
jgi:hypothetical protein